MVVVKVFTAEGIKTVQMLGNVDELPFDEVEPDIDEIVDDGELTVGTPLE